MHFDQLVVVKATQFVSCCCRIYMGFEQNPAMMANDHDASKHRCERLHQMSLVVCAQHWYHMVQLLVGHYSYRIIDRAHLQAIRKT